MLRTEADLLRTLRTGTYTVSNLYELAEAKGLADRPGGRERIQDGKEQYKRRVRSALQQLKRQGRAERVGDGTWLIDGTIEEPRRCLLVLLDGEPGHVELVLGEAADVLRQADEPIDLIVADPPWALERGRAGAAYHRQYERDHSKVIGGYQEVDPAEYADFTARWLSAASDAMRPGGYLAVVTGPQQAARVQVLAEDEAGLTYVNSIAVRRSFGLYVTRRYVHSHARITLLTKGPLDSPLRFFERPTELPRGESGQVYALDVWDDIPRYDRSGLLRYDNALPPQMVSRIVRSCSRHGELVADPFVGSGTTPIVCWRNGRRFYGGDLNPEALRFTMARLTDEEVDGDQLALFTPAGVS